MAAKVSEQLQDFKVLKVGAGGWLTGHAQHADGTLFARADVYGAYLWDGKTRRWSQIITTSAMPEADHRQDNAEGVYEITMSPANSADVWMAYGGRIYRSKDKAKTFKQTAFPQQSDMPANGDAPRFLTRKIAVDPFDSEHVLAGAGKDGLWQTRDGGQSWALVADVALPEQNESQTSLGVSGIIFDLRNQGRLYASSHGHGVYLSEDGGKSFRSLKGGPVNCLKDCDLASDGVLYAVEQEGKHLWRYDGSWFEIASDITKHEPAVVTCDPDNAKRVLFGIFGGNLVMTEDGGESMSSIQWNNDTFGEADIPWHKVQDNKWLAIGGLTFDKTRPGELVLSMGIGFMHGVMSGAPDGISVHWTYTAAGVEELVANQVIATSNGNIGVASWDRAYFRIEDPDQYPDHYEGNWGETIVHCTGIDWCAQEPDVIAMVNFTLGSGVSRDGGRSFTRFGSSPFTDFGDGGGGGEIAVGGRDNYVWAPTNSMQPHWTKDGGESWTPITLPGVANKKEGWDGINWGFYLKRHILAADRVAEGTFYIWHATEGIFVSRDGGENWSPAYGGELLKFGNYNAKMRAVPGQKGHLFATSGPLVGDEPAGEFRWSVNGGKTWSNIDGLVEVYDFGFGAAAPGADYPTVWIAGHVNGDFGIYRSEDRCGSWIKVTSYPLGLIDTIVTIDGDKKVHDRCYVGLNGSGYAYAPGGKVKKAELPPATKPGLIMIPAAMATRFAKRWSKLKTEHMAMEQEIAKALESPALPAATRAAIKKVVKS